MHVNEGNEWLGSIAFGPSDLFAPAYMDPQYTRSKTGERAPIWVAIWPIYISRKLDELYTEI